MLILWWRLLFSKILAKLFRKSNALDGQKMKNGIRRPLTYKSTRRSSTVGGQLIEAIRSMKLNPIVNSIVIESDDDEDEVNALQIKKTESPTTSLPETILNLSSYKSLATNPVVDAIVIESEDDEDESNALQIEKTQSPTPSSETIVMSLTTDKYTNYINYLRSTSSNKIVESIRNLKAHPLDSAKLPSDVETEEEEEVLTL